MPDGHLASDIWHGKKISTYHQRYLPIFLVYGKMISNEGYYGTPETKKRLPGHQESNLSGHHGHERV